MWAGVGFLEAGVIHILKFTDKSRLGPCRACPGPSMTWDLVEVTTGGSTDAEGEFPAPPQPLTHHAAVPLEGEGNWEGCTPPLLLVFLFLGEGVANVRGNT